MEFSKNALPLLFFLKKTSLLVFAVIVSVVIHLLFISSFSIYVKSKSTPVIYSWLDIIDNNELFLSDRKNIVQNDSFLLAENPSKKYFSSTLPDDDSYLLKDKRHKEIVPNPYVPQTIHEKMVLKENTEYVYIWEKQSFFGSEKNEIIPYKMFVSPYGKTIVSFPEKLSSDTQETILLQEYIREASFFLGDKFYWTKLKGVVK